MKLIIQNSRIAATATDDYQGPELYIAAPANFDVARLSDYRYDGDVLTLAPSTRITQLAFRNRFSQPEKVSLELAALDDPAAPMLQRQQAAALRAYLADVAAAVFIDLSRADTRIGVHFLETAGLIGSGRALEVLDTPVQNEERPL